MQIDSNVKTSKGNNVYLTKYDSSGGDESKFVVIAHGFKGFKSWGFFPYAAQYFASKGFCVITFNFSHNGVPAHSNEFTETDKFASNTITLEVSELLEIISLVKSGHFGGEGDIKIGLIGHSRGGGEAVLAAELSADVNALVTWSAVSTFDRYSNRQKEKWKELGFFEAVNTRTGQAMRMNIDYLNEIIDYGGESLSILKAAGKLKIPYLIIHGKEDLAVKSSEALDIYRHCDKQIAALALIDGAGHTFDVVHPFAGSNKKFDQVLEKSFDFFNKNLN